MPTEQQAALDTFCEKRKIFNICQDMNLGSSSPQPNQYTDDTIVGACKLAQISLHRNITWDSGRSERGHIVMQYSTTQAHFLWCLDTSIQYFQCSILYRETERGKLTYLGFWVQKILHSYSNLCQTVILCDMIISIIFKHTAS